MANLLIGYRHITLSLKYVIHVRVALPTIASVLENKSDHIGTLFNAYYIFQLHYTVSLRVYILYLELWNCGPKVEGMAF